VDINRRDGPTKIQHVKIRTAEISNLRATVYDNQNNVMFASINSRTKYDKKQKPGELQTHPLPDKVPRELVTRRIQSLTAILYLSLLRRDIPRAKRAFSILLRCEKHGVTLSTLWELGLEILIRSTGSSKEVAEEFLGRVRLASSEIGHSAKTAQQVFVFMFI
jgi:RNA polymerase I specific initiation factor